MSRALLVIAFADALGRQPTEQEKCEFLAALAKVAGGEYVYVPKLEQSIVDPGEIVRMHGEGMSIRRIAKTLKCSKSTVGRALRQLELSHTSPYEVDTKAA